MKPNSPKNFKDAYKEASNKAVALIALMLAWGSVGLLLCIPVMQHTVVMASILMPPECILLILYYKTCRCPVCNGFIYYFLFVHKCPHCHTEFTKL